MTKTRKSALAHLLFKKFGCDVPPPPQVTVEVIDAMVVIRGLGSPNVATMGDLSRHILRKIVNSSCANEIHIIFDQYRSPSIKDDERRLRGSYCGIEKIIHGPQQQSSSCLQGDLNNESFKNAFIRFLASEWKNDSYTSITKSKVLYFTEGDECYKKDGTQCVKVHNMICSQEEADTRMIFHVLQRLAVLEQTNRPISVWIKSNDTDVLAIALANLNPKAQYYLDFGVGDSKKILDLSAIAQKMGSICPAIVGLHAFTGCDYTSSFYNKGKLKPFKLMLSDNKWIELFSRFGTEPKVKEESKKNWKSLHVLCIHRN